MIKISTTVILLKVFIVMLMLTGLTVNCSTALAGDREDAKVLIGDWKCTKSIFGINNGMRLTFSGDGSYSKSKGYNGKWKVKNGKLLITENPYPATENLYVFELSPDENTLTYSEQTFERVKK